MTPEPVDIAPQAVPVIDGQLGMFDATWVEGRPDGPCTFCEDASAYLDETRRQSGRA